MIHLHLRDGRTIEVDLANGAPELAQLSRPDFQALITAVTVRMKGAQYSLTRPEGFDGAHWFHLERVEPEGNVKGGERVKLVVGDLVIVLMAHAAQPAVRVSIKRMGKRKYNPSAERRAR